MKTLAILMAMLLLPAAAFAMDDVNLQPSAAVASAYSTPGIVLAQENEPGTFSVVDSGESAEHGRTLGDSGAVEYQSPNTNYSNDALENGFGDSQLDNHQGNDDRFNVTPLVIGEGHNDRQVPENRENGFFQHAQPMQNDNAFTQTEFGDPTLPESQFNLNTPQFDFSNQGLPETGTYANLPDAAAEEGSPNNPIITHRFEVEE